MDEVILPDVSVEVPPEGLPIGAAAALCGLSVDTLRYYEREGLTLHPAPRSASGRRRYGVSDLAWLAGLVMLRDTGMPIADIRRYAALARRQGTDVERLQILEQHRREVIARMEQTRKHLAAIDRKIAVYRNVIGTHEP
ncbi:MULTISPECIES: MerR family transcriptional regulator [unclassified Streptomyces]|uniref:MerR family transcriptional regulator n=1 Tax=unclassified Streptomyces TaxID=2593676 RepID=UPI002DDA7884|nr:MULTISPECIES: MerR family transcriptional regulator [unclassified Streptomyces]WSF82950.1 MerR family transcriptional regulator [Streptomyces sp. NBC_01744]WSC40791.1 MerR family transcriptional regulator [Streptomyces sp. NBC_01763]WSC48925.1 MerR family transcriptional regulator [Streptomyces sp. NBC_01762]WSC52103.1 MerR family transcriptional regulator [Streptomyces sp. NBC_01761]WSD28580.1 MerR family transcriptional regulator [Streptomyces sp. NBC_01751]